MTKEENIQYLTLRADECRLPEENVKKVNEALKKLDDGKYDYLKRISEPDFRLWCNEVCSQN